LRRDNFDRVKFMKIVVTGGSGTVGKYVVDELKKGNHDVTVLARGKTSTMSLETMDVAFCKGDICAPWSCKKAFRGAEAVIHLAAIPHLFTKPPEKVFHINVIGTFNVFQAASDVGIEKVVYASSDSSYGFNWRNSFEDILLPEYLPIDETHPQKPKDAYGLSKKVGEEIARTFTRKYGVTTIS
jgi:nucleoside-diphosphate-sugar epimerase